MVDAILPPPAVEVPLLAEPPALAVPPPHGLEVHGHTAGGQLHSHRPHQQHPPNPQAVLVLYLVLFTLVGAQLALVWWKKKHKRSYEMVTLLGLWLMPPIISFHFHYWRFLLVWAAFSAVTGYLLYLCMQSGTLEPTTPRRVFSWFLGTHKVCIALGATGYVLLLLEIFGLGPLIWIVLGKGTTFIMVWYGLYFGVLGRDAAEVVSDRLAVRMAFGRKLAVTPNSCGLCQKDLNDYSHMGGPKPVEPSIQLACKHTFHELCVKGWTMVGKKDSCPVCMEKVDLKALYADRCEAAAALPLP